MMKRGGNAKYFIMRELKIKGDDHRCQTCHDTTGSLSLITYGENEIWMCARCQAFKEQREDGYKGYKTKLQSKTLEILKDGDMSAKEVGEKLQKTSHSATSVLSILNTKGHIGYFKGPSKSGKISRRYYLK